MMEESLDLAIEQDHAEVVSLLHAAQDFVTLASTDLNVEQACELLLHRPFVKLFGQQSSDLYDQTVTFLQSHLGASGVLYTF